MGIQTNRRLTICFYALWLFVIFVSAVDGYLALRHRHDMLSYELNPWGRMLIRWNDGQVWYLLAAKFAGTVVACAAMLVISRANFRLGLVIASALAVAQLGLLLVLLFF